MLEVGSEKLEVGLSIPVAGCGIIRHIHIHINMWMCVSMRMSVVC